MSADVVPGGAGRLGKVLATVGLVLFAAAALLSGTDRQSRLFPNAPSLVGWPYDTGAAQSQAILAFVKTGPASAIGYARRSVLSDPISAQTVSVLGRAQLYAGQLGPAQKSFSVSGQLGWRDAMTQLYWLDQSLQIGDLKVASERLDALLRQNPEDENRDKFLAIVSATPEGRDAISKRLKLSPNWSTIFATYIWNLPLDEISQRVDVMRRAGGGVWDCPTTEQLAQRLIKEGMIDQAQALWLQDCPRSSSLVYDGNFEYIDLTKPSMGFNWSLSDRGDVEIALSQDRSGQHVLDIGVRATVSVPVLRQTVVLKPGRYRLTWQSPDIDQKQAHTLTASLACDAGREAATSGKPDPTNSAAYSVDFTVGTECPAQQLTFWLDPQASTRISNVSLKPL